MSILLSPATHKVGFLVLGKHSVLHILIVFVKLQSTRLWKTAVIFGAKCCLLSPFLFIGLNERPFGWSLIPLYGLQSTGTCPSPASWFTISFLSLLFCFLFLNASFGNTFSYDFLLVFMRPVTFTKALSLDVELLYFIFLCSPDCKALVHFLSIFPVTCSPSVFKTRVDKLNLTYFLLP